MSSSRKTGIRYRPVGSGRQVLHTDHTSRRTNLVVAADKIGLEGKRNITIPLQRVVSYSTENRMFVSRELLTVKVMVNFTED